MPETDLKKDDNEAAGNISQPYVKGFDAGYSAAIDLVCDLLEKEPDNVIALITVLRRFQAQTLTPNS